MPLCDAGKDGDNPVTIFHLVFMYLTYVAVAFVLCGWVMLVYAALKLHAATRTGELLQADCNKGHLELETGQAAALKAYTEGKYKDKLEKALWLVKFGIALLAASLVLSLSYSMYFERFKGAKADNGDDLNWKWRGMAGIWVLLGLYTLSTATATVNISDDKTLTMGFMITALVLLAILFLFVKLTLEKKFFDLEDMVIARGLWLIALVFAGGLWLASTLYYSKIDDEINAYTKKLVELHTALKQVDKNYLLLHIAKNYVSTPQKESRQDDPPSVKSVESLMNGDAGAIPGAITDSVFYIMHFYGEELRDVEARIREEHRENGTSGSIDEKRAIQTVKDVRLKMGELRNLNASFNSTLSTNTGWVIGASALVILIPVFLIYKRVAPAVFGVY